MEPFDSKAAASRPVVVGHRGAPVVAPENTPAAFAAAAAAGAEWVELDARLCADELVVAHDPCATDGVPLVELSAERLRGMGVWSLRDVLAGLPPGLGLDIEVKNLPTEPGYDDCDRAVSRLADLLAPRPSRAVLTSSFTPHTVAALRDALPRVPVGLLTGATVCPHDGLRLAERLGARVLCAHEQALLGRPAAVADVHLAGVAVLAWTVDDPLRATRLAEAGVDALCTNDPAGLLAALDGDG